MIRLLPNTEYQAGDVISTGLRTWTVLRPGKTDDLAQFDQHRHLIDNPCRPTSFHECWICGTVTFIIGDRSKRAR